MCIRDRYRVCPSVASTRQRSSGAGFKALSAISRNRKSRYSPVSYTHLSDYYRRQGIDPEPIVGKLEEDCEHCESCGN